LIINTLWGEEEIIETRGCNYCKRELPLTMFHADSSCHRTQCKDCAKEATKMLKHSKSIHGNPSPPPLGTPCNFCGEFKGKKLTFEHNHDTLEFRGWTCDPCNRAIGILERSLKTSNLMVISHKLIEYAKNANRKDSFDNF